VAVNYTKVWDKRYATINEDMALSICLSFYSILFSLEAISLSCKMFLNFRKINFINNNNLYQLSVIYIPSVITYIFITLHLINQILVPLFTTGFLPPLSGFY